jgi:hypothetical protein
MTYLEMVNDVLVRVREDTVGTVNGVGSTEYGKLIGKLVNDTKRQVEDAWNWDALATEIALTTTGGTSGYVVTGSGVRHKDATVNDVTNNVQLRNAPIQWIINQKDMSASTNAQPAYYAWNGNNGTDSKITLWPTPNAAYNINIRLYVPQTALSGDADVLAIPSDAVIFGTYARALAERGEDGGLSSSDAYAVFLGMLGDQIAIESSRNVENSVWTTC